MVDRTGILHDVEAAFIDRLATEWPDWRGPRLPEALLQRLDAPDAASYAGRTLVAEIAPSPFTDLYTVFVRPLNQIDRLTTRERQIARRFARGESHKEIAARIGLSPATVRVHLSAVYQKTGIANKAALAAMILALDHE